MKKRIVRIEEGYWRIRSEKREIGQEEQRRLTEYFHETRFPYRIIEGRLCVPESVPWDEIIERLDHFYDGIADIYPF